MLSDSIPGEASNQNTSLFFLQERLPMLYQVRAARTIARSLRESAIPASCLLLFSVLPRFSVHIHSCLIVHVFSFINAVCLGFIRHFSHCKDVVNAMCRKDPATSKASDVTRREQGRPALYRYPCPRGRTSWRNAEVQHILWYTWIIDTQKMLHVRTRSYVFAKWCGLLFEL